MIEHKKTLEPARQNLPLAILCICLASLAYTISSVFVKEAASQTTTNVTVCFRYLFCLLAILPWIIKNPKLAKTEHLTRHIIRGICGLLSISAFFYAIRFVPLTQATLLSMSTPLWIPIVLRLTRGIAIIKSLYWGLCLGLLGLILVLHPDTQHFHIALFIALSSAVFRASSATLIRQISKTDATATVLFYYFLVGSIISGATLLFTPHFWQHLPWRALVAVGITGALYQWLLTMAFRWSSARLIAPFTYLSVVYAAIIDWLLWQQSLSLSTASGIVLVISGAIITVVIGQKHIQKKAKT
jgi:drug/metabolite transporter (DMT)-like permease